MSWMVMLTQVLLPLAVLGLPGGYLAWHALKGRVLPAEAVVDIAPPLPPGHYLIAHGGSAPMINAHLKTPDQTVERFHQWRGQSKALDIFRISPLGFHKNGWQLCCYQLRGFFRDSCAFTPGKHCCCNRRQDNNR